MEKLTFIGLAKEIKKEKYDKVCNQDELGKIDEKEHIIIYWCQRFTYALK
jgi:hypothetical protein